MATSGHTCKRPGACDSGSIGNALAVAARKDPSALQVETTHCGQIGS